jgi:hypothetical protein
MLMAGLTGAVLYTTKRTISLDSTFDRAQDCSSQPNHQQNYTPP